jgi:hypothetical protein
MHLQLLLLLTMMTRLLLLPQVCHLQGRGSAGDAAVPCGALG